MARPPAPPRGNRGNPMEQLVDVARAGAVPGAPRQDVTLQRGIVAPTETQTISAREQVLNLSRRHVRRRMRDDRVYRTLEEIVGPTRLWDVADELGPEVMEMAANMDKHQRRALLERAVLRIDHGE